MDRTATHTEAGTARPRVTPVQPDCGAQNRQIAVRLRDYADLLESQGDDGFRIRAYRNAAQRVESLPESVAEIYARGGPGALVDIPGIGRGIAAAIAEMLTTGHWAQLDRLRGEATPEALFRSVPGIGDALARRLVTQLDVETLEELEIALRLDDRTVPGIGPRRREAILAALSERLSRFRRMARPGAHGTPEPPVSLLLDADAVYRRKAEAGALRRIAPRRFNRSGEAWLPIMHGRRRDWHVTVLYSNTAQAHQLRRTRDWVVIYFHQDDGENDGPEARRTVVTERQGPLRGRRVVRGREEECAAYYGIPLQGDRSRAAQRQSSGQPSEV